MSMPKLNSPSAGDGKIFPAGSVSTGLIKHLLQFSREHKLQFDLLEAESLLSNAQLSDLTIRVDLSVYERIVERLLQNRQNRSLGSDFGRFISQRGWTNTQFIIVMHCANAQKMLRKVIEYDSLLFDGDPLRIIEYPRLTTVRIGDSHFSDQVKQFTCEAIISGIDNLLNLASSDSVTPQFIRLPFRCDGASPLYNICQEIRFNQTSAEIVYRTADLLVQNQLADSELLKSLEAYAASRMEELGADCWSKRLFKVMSLDLVDPPNTLDNIAKHFSISGRRLQQRLKQEGTTFRQILDEVRVVKSYRSLKNPSYSLSDIALMVGFSEQSSFNHFFKNHTGMTPSEFRRNSLDQEL